MLRSTQLREYLVGEAARLAGGLVFKRVEAPDLFEIGLRGMQTRYMLTRRAFHSAHASIARRAPAPVCEFAGPEKSVRITGCAVPTQAHGR